MPLLRHCSTRSAFLPESVHHPNPEPLPLQGKRVEFVSDQAHTPLDNCTPTVGSLLSFVLCWERDRVKWCVPMHYMKYCLLSSQHRQQCRCAIKSTGWGGRGELFGWGIVSGDSHKA